MAQPTPEGGLTDQQILHLTQQIKDEHAKEHPLVGQAESIDALRQEYLTGSETFSRKINWLEANGYKHVRRLRGDGDCFYRALAFALVLSVIAQGPLQCEQLLQRLQLVDPQIYAFADKEIVDDFAEPVKAMLGANDAPLLSPEQILAKFNEDEVSNSAVVYFRLLASAQLRMDADTYFPFLFAYEDDGRILDPQTGLPSMAQFCSHYVYVHPHPFSSGNVRATALNSTQHDIREATSRDADHLAIQALTKALGVSLRVAYLDQSKTAESGQQGRAGQSSVDFVTFDDGGQFTLQGNSVLLLRPGHYDILS